MKTQTSIFKLQLCYSYEQFDALSYALMGMVGL